MQRRALLALSALSATTLAVGLGVSSWSPGLGGGRLTLKARALLQAVATSVLDGMRPPIGETAMAEHLNRLDQLVSGLPIATRDEISDLLGILAMAPGRFGLAGLATPWAAASQPAVNLALQSMRNSQVLVKQQAYQALRELTMAAHFSAESSWAQLGYPGPRPL